MTDSPCSPEQLISRQTATYHLVPFVARFFTHGGLRADSPLLSEDPADFTAESIVRLTQIWRRVTWQYLARQNGWKSQPLGHRGTPTRLWQIPFPPLKFTGDSMALCVRVYNATRPNGSLSRMEIPSGLAASGDLILQHLAFQRLYTNPMAAGVPSNYLWTAWASSPMNVAWQPTLVSKALPPKAWDRLTEPDLAPLLPWIIATWAIRWTTASAESQATSLETWQQWQQSQKHVLDGLCTALVDAGHLSGLIPLLAWFSSLAASLPVALEQFEIQTTSISYGQRYRAAEDWHHNLAFAEILQNIATDCTAIHPADRELCHRQYLAAVHSTGFTEALPNIRAVRQKLRPVLT